MNKESVNVTGIWLRTIGDQVQVLAEVDGKWRITHEEPLHDGSRTVISHIAEPGAIRDGTLDPVIA